MSKIETEENSCSLIYHDTVLKNASIKNIVSLKVIFNPFHKVVRHVIPEVHK